MSHLLGHSLPESSTQSWLSIWGIRQNDISISLKDVSDAPADREIDLQNIKGFGIFVPRLKDPTFIYIDYVRLENWFAFLNV